MFSGRWDENLIRDEDGRVFLDEDSELIEIILNFLREKKREDPTKEPVRVKTIRKEKKQAFDSLLDYYGLTDYFYPFETTCNIDLDVSNVVHDSSEVSVSKLSHDKIQFCRKILLYKGGLGSFVAYKERLYPCSGRGAFWKLMIDALLDGTVVLLGIIGVKNLDDDDRNDNNVVSENNNNQKLNLHYEDFKTVYGWEGASLISVGGCCKDSSDTGWTDFVQGECLYFHLKSNRLTMYSVQKNQKFTIDILENNATTTTRSSSTRAEGDYLQEKEEDAYYYIHFDLFRNGTKITLEPLVDEEERERVL